MRVASGVQLGYVQSSSFYSCGLPRPLVGAVPLFQRTNLPFLIICGDGVGAGTSEQKGVWELELFLMCSPSPLILFPHRVAAFHENRYLQVFSLSGVLWRWVLLLLIVVHLCRHLGFKFLRYLKCFKNLLEFLMHSCPFPSLSKHACASVWRTRGYNVFDQFVTLN